MSDPKEDLWEYFKNRFGKLPKLSKFIVAFMLIMLVIVSARLNFLGNNAYKITKKFVSVPLWDDEKPLMVPLSLNYEIADRNLVTRKGKLNDICYTGDRITVMFKVGVESWITVVGIDVRGMYYIFPDNKGVVKIEKGEPYYKSFSLDKTTGIEIYYAIASHGNFDFEKEVEPALKKAQKFLSESEAKGANRSRHTLDLPNTFTQSHIYFKHLEK